MSRPEINSDPYYLNKDLINLIGVAGEAEHGKGTFCEIAAARFDFREEMFSLPVKKIAAIAFGLTKKQVLTSEGKAEFHAYWDMTCRTMQQFVGDDAFKPVFGNEVWVRNFHQRLFKHFIIDNTTDVILSDLRCEVEVNYILDMGGHIVYVNRPGYESSLTAEERNHSSEVYVRETLKNLCRFSASSKYHYIENDCPLDEFKNRCVTLLNKITRRIP